MIAFGIYDGPEGGPRKKVVQIAFLCRIVGGESRQVAKIDAMESLSEAEVKDLEIAFDRKQTN